MNVPTPALLILVVPPNFNEPSDRSRSATCDAVELRRVRVLVAAPVTSSVVSPPVRGTLVSAMVRSLNVFAPVKVCVPSRNAKVPVFEPERSGNV